jgi:hypothetical protein
LEDAGGAGGAGGAGEGGQDAGVPTEPDFRDELWRQVEERQAREDAQYDEYGIEQPGKSHTERWVDEVAPPEIMNDPRVSDTEKVARAFGAAGASFAGHVADQFPIPIFSELQHGEEVAEYNRRRAEAEEAERQRAIEEAQSHLGPVSCGQGPCPACESERFLFAVCLREDGHEGSHLCAEGDSF